ncbi:MAG: hypothetical protein AAF206_12155, partial [Bacteroidota bacterium]
MKQISLLFALCCYFISVLPAQNPPLKIEWGPPEEPAFSAATRIGQSFSGYYDYVQRISPIYEIRRFDQNMKRISSGRISMLKDGQKRHLIGIVMMQGRMFVFTSFYELKSNEDLLLMEELDPINLQLQGEPIAFDRIKAGRHTGFRIRVSTNENNLLVFTRTSLSGGDPESYRLAVYSENLVERWKSSMTLDHKSRQFKIEDVRLNNQGEVFVSGKRRVAAGQSPSNDGFFP